MSKKEVDIAIKGARDKDAVLLRGGEREDRIR